MSEKNTQRSGLLKKFFIALSILFLLLLAFTGFNYYFKYYGPNVTDNQDYLYIKTGSGFADVLKTIKQKGIVKDSTSFMQVAYSEKYENRVKPGKYRLHKGMSNKKLIRMLALGEQEQVKLAFQNVRLKETFAGMIGKKLEADSVSIIRLLDSTAYLKPFGFTPDNVYVMFMPNSYKMYWNGSAEKFFTRMNDEYQKFWTSERKEQAKAAGLTPVQVSILASIVDAEALHDNEMPAIAGLYLNRLNRGMKLEADPTVIFALKDFTIKRVLNKYLVFNSPYNTYLNTGLPPGPIMMPSVNAVKAVLNYKKHNYIYMCAKDDFSGYHNFATNMADHLVNAHKFQQALNDRNIKR
ncbi:MAG: endolytic transglycosylase MltG [Janthinobacterium lividum]